MANIKDLANLLGVEIGEEFEVPELSSCKYRFTENSLESYGDSDKWIESTGAVIYALLKGEVKIVKKPWKPKYGNKYFFIHMDGKICHTSWNEEIFDYLNYAVGNCFQTEERAEDNKEEIIYLLKSIYKDGKHEISVPEAAKAIKDYCSSREKGCNSCRYCSSEGICDFDWYPSSWDF